MLLSITLSKPVKNIEQILEKPYTKIRIKLNTSSAAKPYFAEFFTATQVFHKTFSPQELDNFLTDNAGKTFKSCVKRFDDHEETILANKKGELSTLTRKLNAAPSVPKFFGPSANRKNYILPEGTPVPFLVTLGIMTPDGKIINSRYDKFRQINRYLEFIADILPQVLSQKEAAKETNPLTIADFGCGKSYLTFAVHYFLTVIKNIDCSIVGLDLKKDVIEHCNNLAKELSCKNLIFKTGDISEYEGAGLSNPPDIVITLHACDTATDFAIQYAIEKKAKAILTVPCCQHQINTQLSAKRPKDSGLEVILKHGLLREKFSSLLTDAVRADFLEQTGYKVQVLEFIDMEHTPKNILLRAVRKADNAEAKKIPSLPELLTSLGINQELFS
ncbi:MAG: SAM-dependent methyltransferase [Treponema sp.]|nr:SAM-dependent methyltransferase [Treponema sp.]